MNNIHSFWLMGNRTQDTWNRKENLVSQMRDGQTVGVNGTCFVKLSISIRKVCFGIHEVDKVGFVI